MTTRVKQFVQIAPVVINDGVREKLIVFALDARGACWMRLGVDEGPGEWVRVEQPAISTGDALTNTVEG